MPYVGSLDPFDPELTSDALIWPEGEKDVDTLTRLGVPAFTFGGTGDGLPVEAASYLKGRQVVILADNDDGGRSHAEKEAPNSDMAVARSRDAQRASCWQRRSPPLWDGLLPYRISRLRIGLSTNSASAATTRFIVVAVTKTQCQWPL
jgi:hypothetical protein